MAVRLAKHHISGWDKAYSFTYTYMMGSLLLANNELLIELKAISERHHVISGYIYKEQLWKPFTNSFIFLTI